MNKIQIAKVLQKGADPLYGVIKNERRNDGSFIATNGNYTLSQIVSISSTGKIVAPAKNNQTKPFSVNDVILADMNLEYDPDFDPYKRYLRNFSII